MKRLVPLLLLVVAFALGAATVAKLNTYSYVPDAMNEPCGKTVFEWNLMARQVDSTPVMLNGDFEIIKLVGEPKPTGLLVRAYLKPRDPKLIMPDSLRWNSFLGGITGEVGGQVRKRFGMPDGPQGPPNAYILTHIGDRLVSVWRAGQMVALKPDATREEQLAAMARVLLPTPVP